MKKNHIVGLLLFVCAQTDLFPSSSKRTASHSLSLSGLVPPPEPTSLQLAPSSKAKKFAQQNAATIAKDIMKNNTGEDISGKDVQRELDMRDSFNKQLFNIIDRNFIIAAIQGAIDALQQEPAVDDQAALEKQYQQEQLALAEQQAAFEKQKEAMKKQEAREQEALRKQLDRQKKEQNILRKELNKDQTVLDQQRLKKVVRIVKELVS